MSYRYAPQIVDRASALPDPHTRHRCTAPGCGKTTMRGEGKGLSYSYCRKHVEFISRHGSSWRKSLTGAELVPYRRATSRWLEANAGSPEVLATVAAIERMMAEAGSVIIAPLLWRESPESRARQVLARMRVYGVSPRKVLLEALATAVAVRSLDGIPRDDEFWSVQVAKRVHRLGSAWRIMDGRKVTFSWHPQPRGHLLRHLGGMMLEALDKGFGPQELGAIAGLAGEPKA
jgi:hypothetical protein